ncbi:conserved hypothetical protein [Histoplasma capsulatum G186AR]|uniref:Acyltransferase 3 domain-containing protein n=2 Tax=Ajellomyces capsulatus TaxID=5037 RepID=C0NY37_AJECG|nr:uncharacterized protein HCBG_07831 [Histoplasma capsulatum G186AR]EEH03705.1 conserved hypothetical protein [Histoplasma capsulatum G186AR]
MASAGPKKREDNWVDGLRGVASFIVVTGHICTAFVPYLHSPAPREGAGPLLFQLPFFRLVVGGRGAVAIFFIITGFVNSLNPVKNSRNNNTSVALVNLARSTFTRSGRLVLPTSIAICIAWFLAQMGAFHMASRVNATWIRVQAHPPDSSWGEALIKLFRALTLYWNTGPGEYDGTHWTLVYFLQGSFRIYLALLAMMLLKTRYWRLVTLFLYVWCWSIGDYIVGINIFAGLMLAQLQVDLGSRATSFLPKPVPSLIIIMGLFIWSFPQHNAEWMYWSRIMKHFLEQIIPNNTDISRYWVSIGTSVLMVGIFFSRNARKVLTNPVFNFLGRVSFPVYLLHNSLMRTILVWMAYWHKASTTPIRDAKGDLIQLPQPGGLAFVFILPVFYTVLYAVAYSWTIYVDPVCAKAVDWMKRMMFKEEEQQPQSEKPAPLTAVVA